MEPSCSGTTSSLMFVTRQELYDILCESGFSDVERQFEVLKEKLVAKTNCGEEKYGDLNSKISTFKYQFRSRWAKAYRKRDRFLIENRIWLDSSIGFPRAEVKRGRPALEFEKCSDRTRRQKTKQLRATASVSALSYATQMALRASGQVEASKLLREISMNPEVATSYTEIMAKQKKSTQLSADEALAVFVDAKLSRHQYQVIRENAPDKFPSYKQIQAAKKLCYPNSMKITATSAEVTLQCLLDHTVQRLVSTLEENLLEEVESKAVCLISKWGFDGSSGHSSYKQAFYNLEREREVSDAYVFITCVVPIRLQYLDKVIWQNPRPASTRFCRPIKINYSRESTELSCFEKERVDKEIQNLHTSTVIFKTKLVEVRHTLVFTMIDGKVCNALTDTKSTQKCYICGATAKDFNQIDKMIQREINTNNLQFGLSVLHGWIRMFECLLHVSYKLPIKKWQARGEDEKKLVAENKLRIQNEFKRLCGLIVDQPKPGFGNSNDGNTARRFFKESHVSAKITGIDEVLIKKMHTIMIVVSSGLRINVDKFREFALETARYFVLKYPWYHMPPTLHKYFIHGPEIISSALLPIGQLTEECQEARNKDFKRYRESFSRKCSREKTNADILHQFLISSDPVINSKRKLPKKKIQKLPKEVLHLIDQNIDNNTENSEGNASGNDSGDNYSSSDDDDYNAYNDDYGGKM